MMNVTDEKTPMPAQGAAPGAQTAAGKLVHVTFALMVVKPVKKPGSEVKLVIVPVSVSVPFVNWIAPVAVLNVSVNTVVIGYCPVMLNTDTPVELKFPPADAIVPVQGGDALSTESQLNLTVSALALGA